MKLGLAASPKGNYLAVSFQIMASAAADTLGNGKQEDYDKFPCAYIDISTSSFYLRLLL